MDLRVMSPSGSQDGRKIRAVFLTTLPRCGAVEEVAVYEAHDSQRSEASPKQPERRGAPISGPPRRRRQGGRVTRRHHG